ncbi:acyl carrier protein [Pseudoclavibacter sp. VKM Ac-2888]|uniref:acyl carrier protein n=1 Tax=Pseudoclavibacter sp. VKM Ac-2888 TaxID=2783830 RepID=UPI00188B9EBF|nr:acyl carrier protein [Pseudoclavibacter sp. VKM Ac-2888]MBF4549437.1 acyl carrier protein [Pseudoclavibacter sp. VKM Ac-2888]
MTQATRSAIQASLIELVQDEFLDGDEELTHETPLLEWGVLKSIELTRLVNFIETEYRVRVPAEAVIAENMRDINAISSLVENLLAVPASK